MSPSTALIRPVLLAMLALSPAAANAAQHPRGIDKIDTVVVIYLENHSFDNLFGLFPGASGIGDAIAAAPKQVNRDGSAMATLPQPLKVTPKGASPDDRFPAGLPNAPFLIDAYMGPNMKTGDLVHRFYTQQEQIDGGKNDKFVSWGDSGGLTMGHYDGSKMSLWTWARRYTLLDRFFMGGFGGSFFNHMVMACACAPRFDNAPADMVSVIGGDGHVVKDGAVTPDGFAVNTVFSTYQPHPAAFDAPEKKGQLLPPQDAPTLGDRLSEKNVTWAWYSGGFADAVAGKPDPSFQFHHQPYAYFQKYGDGTQGRAQHLKDGAEFIAAIDRGTLPQVSFYKPIGDLNEHPGYADVTSGDLHVQYLLDKLEKSPQWGHMAVIVTFDENGGFYDHVPPPKGDRFGPGVRIPTVVVSPFARKGMVDHTTYDTLSILKFIETRWNLRPLAVRDAKADPLSGAFDFDRE